MALEDPNMSLHQMKIEDPEVLAVGWTEPIVAFGIICTGMQCHGTVLQNNEEDNRAMLLAFIIPYS